MVRLVGRAVRHVAGQWLGIVVLLVVVSGGTVFGGTGNQPTVTTGTTFHSVGLPTIPNGGTCPDTTAAYSYAPAILNAAAYGRDSDGFVHLRGTLEACVNKNTSTLGMFNLPAGFRPFRRETVTNVTNGDIQVHPDGSVVATFVFSGPLHQFEYLDSITFRCAPSGVAGCP